VTIAVSGPGYEASSWYGALVPAHTPPAVIARLHPEIVKVLADPGAACAARRPGLRTGRQLAGGIRRVLKSEITKGEKQSGTQASGRNDRTATAQGEAGGDSKSDADSGKNTAAARLHVIPAFPGCCGEILVLQVEPDRPEAEFHARQS